MVLTAALRWADMMDSGDESELGVSSGEQSWNAGPTAMVHPAERHTLWADMVDSDDESEARESAAAEDAPPRSPNGKVGEGLPEASEEVWQHREDKRRKIVEMVKASDAYQLLESHRRKPGGRAAGASAPRSPDPSDRSISKRKWETSIAAWKAELRNWSAHEEALGSCA